MQLQQFGYMSHKKDYLIKPADIIKENQAFY